MSLLIGITGRKGAGKTTLADYLAWHHNFQHIAFSDPMNAMLEQFQIFAGGGSAATWFSTPGVKDRPNDLLYGKAPRDLLKSLGTDWGRNMVDENVWIDMAFRQIGYPDAMSPRVVISDVRFPNEADAIRAAGGKIVKVENPITETMDFHVSETNVDLITPDVQIFNNFGAREDYCSYAAGLILSLDV